MKKQCAICRKKIGILTAEFIIDGGKSVCYTCLPLNLSIAQHGNDTVLENIKNISLDDVRLVVSGDTVKLDEIKHAVLTGIDASLLTTKEEKEIQKFMEKYHLEDLDEKDLVVLRKIAYDMWGQGFFKFASLFESSSANAQTHYLSVLVQQNWFLMRQLGRLNRNIEKIVSKCEEN